MKQIDNRQKQQIMMRAAKGPKGGVHPAHSKEKNKAPETPAENYEAGKAAAQNATVHSVKIGRNEPCPCGSGKKYKKCCLKD